MGMTSAERQCRYRERRAAGEPARTFQRSKDRRSRPRRWADALAELRTLQAEYEAWRVCDVDLDTLDVELPRGFGRD